MTNKGLSAEVGFINNQRRDTVHESSFNETSALESPKRVGLTQRAVELCRPIIPPFLLEALRLAGATSHH